MLEPTSRRDAPLRVRPPTLGGLSRVPEITAYFWIIKVLTTGMGESTSDYLVHTLGPPAAVLATFALGTAAGDMTARTLGLGYLGSGVMFAALIAVPAIAYRRFAMDPILAFWFAYIVTRPLGASFADWMSVSPARGGLGLGYGTVSLLLSVLIVGFVAYLASSRIDVAAPVSAPAVD